MVKERRCSMQIAILAITFGAMYFFAIRPQQKRQKELIALRNSLVVGDSITTIGGITGTITKIDDDTLFVQTSESTTIAFKMYAVAKRETQSTDQTPTNDDDSTVIND